MQQNAQREQLAWQRAAVFGTFGERIAPEELQPHGVRAAAVQEVKAVLMMPLNLGVYSPL